MKKILVIGQSYSGKTEIAVQHLKQQYGEDCVVYTTEEARKEGLKSSDFENIPSYKITPTPLYTELIPNPFIEGKYKLGKGGKARNRSKFKNR